MKGRVSGPLERKPGGGGGGGEAPHPDLLDVLSVSLHPADLSLFKSLHPLTHPRQPSSWTQPIYIPTAALEEAGRERRGGRGGEEELL